MRKTDYFDRVRAAADGPYGTAETASIDEIAQHARLGAGGLPIAHLTYDPKSDPAAIDTLARLSPPDAELVNGRIVQPLRYDGDRHHLCVARAGGGKYQSALGPLLDNLQRDASTGSCVVIDPKGEALEQFGRNHMQPYGALSAADYAAQRFAPLMWVDPFDVSRTGVTFRINIFDLMERDRVDLVERARALAEVLIVRAGNGDNFWDNAGMNLVTGLLLYVAFDPTMEQKGKRSLQGFYEILSDPLDHTDTSRSTLRELLQALSDGALQTHVVDEKSKSTAKAIAAAATAFLDDNSKTAKDVLSTVRAQLGWMQGAAMQRVLGDGGIDLKRVAEERAFVFVVPHVDFLASHAPWLRVCTLAFIWAFRRYKAPHAAAYANRRHIFIDEFPALGRFKAVEQGVAEDRGQGIQYHLYVQTFAQLKATYGDPGWETFVNTSFIQAFGIEDLFTADYLSKKLGAGTREILTAGISDGTSSSRSQGSSTSSTTGSNTSSGSSRLPFHIFTTSQQGSGTSSSETFGTSESFTTGESWSASLNINFIERAVARPDELMRLGRDRQVLLLGDMNGIAAGRSYFFERAAWTSTQAFTFADVVATLGQSAPGDVVVPDDQSRALQAEELVTLRNRHDAQTFFAKWLEPPPRPAMPSYEPVLLLPAPPRSSFWYSLWVALSIAAPVLTVMAAAHAMFGRGAWEHVFNALWFSVLWIGTGALLIAAPRLRDVARTVVASRRS